MELKTLNARFRQIYVIDQNAHAIYAELSELVKDESLRKVFVSIAKDELRHIALGKELLSLLEK